jgi:2,4-dienoyl-CoA reductase (NADPH2)
MTALADPLQAGPLSLRNRIVATAHGTGLVRNGLGLPGDAEYWRRVADGGVAMAIVGGTVVAAESAYRGGNVLEAFRDDAIPGLRARAEAIKAGGAVAVQQLVHLGRETLGAPMWYAPVAPSAVRSPREPVAPRPLTPDEVEGVGVAFTHSARNVAEAGFDGVELHAAHGYLIAQFLSPETNLRTDCYGGDREGRVRLLAEIVAAIRDLDAGLVVGARVSLEPGLDVAELAAILSTLAKSVTLDWVNLTVGPRGEYVKDMGTERPPLLGQFAPVRDVVRGPLLVSHGFRERADFDAALAEGADLVGTARAVIADASFPRKLLEGRDREIRGCVSCNEDCRLFDPVLLCTVNPDLGLPGEPRRRAKPLLVQNGGGGGRVAVVGAGPGGLECATTLARAGRDVTLFEQGDALGGALAIAATAPNRGGWQRILDFYRAAVDEGSVELLLGTPPAAEQLTAFDDLVVAVGSSEVLPELDGAASARTVTSALAGGTGAIGGAERVAVVDDGFGWWPCVSAVELALAAGAKEIAVITPSGAFAVGIPHESRIQLMPRLVGARIETRSFLVPISFDGGGVVARHRFSGATERVDADVVVVVGERRPAPFDGEVPVGARVQAIGDTVVPRRVAHAVAEGRAAAETILAA